MQIDGENFQVAFADQEVHFVELEADGQIRLGGYAPYLDYRPAKEGEHNHLRSAGILPVSASLPGPQQAITHAVEQLVPRHLNQVRQRREALIDKTMAAVQERLTREINYWDGRSAELRRQEKDGRRNARLNSQQAQKRADELAERLTRRKEELALERQLSAAMPVVISGALIIPAGLLLARQQVAGLQDCSITEAIAMQAVMKAEIALGNHPRDVSQNNLGYDIESFDPQDENGRLPHRHTQPAAAVISVALYHFGQLTAPAQGEQPRHFVALTSGKVGVVDKNHPGIIQMTNCGPKKGGFRWSWPSSSTAFCVANGR